uniref:Uncharacterized protein n=1 Tax=Sphaerodactylus townsendi TaxID=933632 RepID=A0ACB8F664_9SAUR
MRGNLLSGEGPPSPVAASACGLAISAARPLCARQGLRVARAEARESLVSEAWGSCAEGPLQPGPGLRRGGKSEPAVGEACASRPGCGQEQRRPAWEPPARRSRAEAGAAGRECRAGITAGSGDSVRSVLAEPMDGQKARLEKGGSFKRRREAGSEDRQRKTRQTFLRRGCHSIPDKKELREETERARRQRSPSAKNASAER